VENKAGAEAATEDEAGEIIDDSFQRTVNSKDVKGDWGRFDESVSAVIYTKMSNVN
jgi:hypothetical protein